MEALLAFGAALLALRLAGRLLGRRRERGEPQLAAWAAASAPTRSRRPRSPGARPPAGAIRSSASTTSSAGCSRPRCSASARCSSTAAAGRRPLGLVYAGLAVGVAIAVPLTSPVTGDSIPEAQDHLDFVPARLLAVLGNSLGTIAVVAVALLTIRRRPVGNALIVAGVAVAAAGSGLAGLGVAETAAFVAARRPAPLRGLRPHSVRRAG